MNNAAPDAGPHDDAEDRLRIRTGTINGFCKRKAVRIVRDRHRPSEAPRQISRQRAAVQPGRVAVLHASRLGNDGAGRTDADGSNGAAAPFRLDKQCSDGLQASLVVARRGGLAETLPFDPAF